MGIQEILISGNILQDVRLCQRNEQQHGIADKDEFYNVMRFAFPELTTEESDKIFNSIDRKNPETVTYDEFTAHIKKHPEYYSLFLAYKKQSAAAKESDESKKEK